MPDGSLPPLRNHYEYARIKRINKVLRINFRAVGKRGFGGIIYLSRDIAVFKEDYQDMSVITIERPESDVSGASDVPCSPREHLHLHMVRTHWATCKHENLGAHLQDALTALDREGWEVVTAYVVGQTPEVILRRSHDALRA
jgi:hypothetical protein